MYFSFLTVNHVYDHLGKKVTYTHEDLDIEFNQKTSINVYTKVRGVMSVSLTSVLPTLVNIGFQLTTSALERNSKKYSAEYVKHKSNIEAANGKAPGIELIRKVTIKKDYSKNAENSLYIKFVPEKVDGIAGFVYWVEQIVLLYSSAKAISSKDMFDYTIELKPTFLKDGKKMVQDLSPIVIIAVKFKGENYDKNKHRSDIILMPAGSLLTEMSIKVVESNPIRIRAEDVLTVWNENKENAKTLIENILPREPEDG